MIKFIFSLAVLVLTGSGLIAQSVPTGMKYQAVARNLRGEVLSSQKISLQVTLISENNQLSEPHYSEVHDIVTNSLGLFDLVIGEGKSTKGAFKDVPWSTTEIWMQVAINEGNAGFTVISNSKLLAVPYAFHAATAGELASKNSRSSNMASARVGAIAEPWTLGGNNNMISNNLGTSDYQDLVLITNNSEKIRFSKDGDVNFKASIVAEKNLAVKGNVGLNIFQASKLLPRGVGSTTNNGQFIVANESPTWLTGKLAVTFDTDLKGFLNVAGPTNLNGSLQVNNGAGTNLTGSLTVDKVSFLNSNLNVANGTPTDLTGTLKVSEATDLKSTLAVAGATNLNSTLNVNNGFDTRLTGTLEVGQLTRFKDGLTVMNKLPTTLTGTLNVAEPTLLRNTLTVEKATNLNSSLSVNLGAPSLLTGTLTVDKATVLNSGLAVKNGSPTDLSGTLSVTKATDLKNTLTVAGATNLNSTLMVNNGSSTGLTGTLTVDKESLLNSSLTVANGSPSTLTGTLAVTKATDLKNTLTVAEATTLNNSLTVANGSPSTLTGTLAVTKATDLKNTLTVANATTLNSSLTVANGSPSTLTGTLAVTNATDLKNTLTVANATTLNSSLTVANGSPSSLTGTLTVDKDATFNQKVLLSNSSLGSTSTTTGALVVNGGLGLGQNLNVGGTATFEGPTGFNGQFEIKNLTPSTSATTGAAIIAGGTGIGKELNVGGATALGSTLSVADNVTMAKTLAVTGATTLGNTLAVTGAITLANTLAVAGTTTLNGNLTANNPATFVSPVVVNGVLSVKSLEVTNTSENFLATLQNTNGNGGDGLKIKLGKTNPMWNGSYINVPSPAADAFDGAIKVAKGWIIDKKTPKPGDFLEIFPATLAAGSAINIVNTVIENLNEKMSLPISIGPWSTPVIPIIPKITITPRICIPAGCVELCYPNPSWDDPFNWDCDDVCTPEICTPAWEIGPYDFPQIKIIDKILLLPVIPKIDADLPSLSLPNFSFTDVQNSLNNQNEFLSFVDKDNKQLGSVRAQSISNFRDDYLDGVYFVNLMSSLVGIDFVSGIAGATAGFTELADAYNKIGVEYSSGHGDYAEWLERINPEEVISAGDIVAVKGGKITRDLKDAEQIMAVSYMPIILGNAPTEGKEYNGNKIAFMGQVPVKVMGAVDAGDYIVAKNNIKGYGIAVKPSKLNVNDYQLIVGRAWETNQNEGPKMINTLVGNHNRPMLDVLHKQEEKVSDIETRLKLLEIKSDNYLKIQWLKKQKNQLINSKKN